MSWCWAELRNPRMAALSIAAAAGGMLVPAAIYAMMQWGQEGAHGWGIAMATDTAFVIGCLAVLGRRIPQGLRVFMLSLAIIDDIGAILVVAIGYGRARGQCPLQPRQRLRPLGRGREATALLQQARSHRATDWRPGDCPNRQTSPRGALA